MEKIGHDTVAKYLFTSGSPGMPKGVIQTHRMMMARIAAAEALRSDEPDPNEIPQSRNGCRGTTFRPAISVSTAT